MMEQIQILRATRERLFEVGWQKGSFGSSDGPNCLLGALYLVPSWGSNIGLEDLLEEGCGGRNIAYFNDRDETTFDDIVDLIDRAIKKLEGGIGGEI